MLRFTPLNDIVATKTRIKALVHRVISVAVCVLFSLSLIYVQPASAQPEPSGNQNLGFDTKDKTSITLPGTLEGGIIAIGGETTGFILKNVSFDIDMSKIPNAEQLNGQNIYVKGNFELRRYVERGPVWTFKATSATSAS
jgi:hypothetical protein